MSTIDSNRTAQFASFKVHQSTALPFRLGSYDSKNRKPKNFMKSSRKLPSLEPLECSAKLLRQIRPGRCARRPSITLAPRPPFWRLRHLRMIDMTDRSESDEAIHVVVMNDEEQYSIWPADKKIPDGWHAVGTRGSKAECLQYIEETWTDMRPLSLRKRIAERTGPDH